MKKLLAILMTIAMLLSTLTCAMLVPASAESNVWDGSLASAYAGGSGTASDPYLIANAAQFAKMATADSGNNSANYKLTADIYLNDVSAENWTSDSPNLWTGSQKFTGSLDGDGHTIYGLYINGDSITYAGLFQHLQAWDGNITISNVTVSDSYINNTKSGGYAGVFAGFVYNYSGNVFNKCYITDSVYVSAKGGAGGFIGYGNNSIQVTNSASCATVSGSSYNGGIVGYSGSCSIKVENSFIVGNPYKGGSATVTATNSYENVNASAIIGEAAKTAMPDLDWNIWGTDKNGYPVIDGVVDFNGSVGEVWNGYVAEGYAGGTGKANDPYIIETPNQLARMIKNDVIDTASNNASFSMGKYYKLAADIYLNDVSDPNWRNNKPNSWYGSSSSCRFGGNIDGDGHTIYGLYYNGSESAGLIPFADIYSYDITIKDLIISDAYFNTSSSFVGTILGYLYGNAETGRSFTISGCFVDDNVYVTSTNSYPYIGGMVGTLRSNSYNNYNFIGSATLADVRYSGEDGWKRYGGLVGPCGDGNFNINNCFAFPNYSATSLSATNSYGIPSHEALLTIQGAKAVETMPDFDWENGAFAPVNDGYPRLKSVSEKMGDVNGDNLSNSADLAGLRKHFIGTEISYVSDMNSDGQADIRDLVNLKKKVANAVIADSFVPAGYNLVWNDEFYGRTIDDSKWRTDQARMHGTEELGNIDDATVRTVNNGSLSLTAYKNPDLSTYNGKQYLTTNSITTENRMSYRYGYLEVRARVPYKEGCWPSLWLRSPNASGNEGTDAYEMEVDVIEVFGATDKNKVTIHETNRENDEDHTQVAGESYTFTDAKNLANEYHTYGFFWTADGMSFYIDGVEFVSYTKAQFADLGYKGNFDDTVNILFNNHLFTTSSENMLGGEDNIIENYEENLPAEFDIDYVRLYQAENNGSLLVVGE